jgi:hypothetical protein
VNSRSSKTFFFAMSTPDAVRDAIVRLSGVFHVVPSAAPEAELLLSVEVDDDYPELVDEVRGIVAEIDAASAELREKV